MGTKLFAINDHLKKYSLYRSYTVRNSKENRWYLYVHDDTVSRHGLGKLWNSKNVWGR